MSKYFVVGGAGFIGSHLVRHVLADEPDATATIYDNFSSGREWHLGVNLNSPRVTIIRGDVKDLPALRDAMAGHDHVYHFASNPDIAKAVKQPDIDFWEGTYLTQNVLEAMRQSGVKRLTYASGSGVYGDTGTTPAHEDYAPMLPISTYGASKLAGEALIGAYCYMFELNALAFRFANVVGPHQTHGVTYDFVRRLLKDPTTLHILGDGTQSKSYVHVDDVVGALRFVAARGMDGFGYYNVATQDYVTVTQIAELVVECLGLKDVKFTYAGGSRGWKGDVPIVRFDSSKLRNLGWSNKLTARAALWDSIESMITDAKAGRFDGPNAPK
jgi:UDP-glucose 4-epimerase